MAQPQPPQIAPLVFPEAQQRAINDAFARIAVPPGHATVLTPHVADGQYLFQISVSMPSALYTVKVETTWFTQWKVNAKTARLLTIETSAPAAAGDTLRVELS